MAGAGDRDKALAAGAGFITGPAHVAGDEIVVFSVEEDHGDPGSLQSLQGRDRLQVEVSEELRAQLHEGVGRPRGELHLPDHLLDDVLGAVIAAVRQDADDLFGEPLVRAGHDRGSAHGDARQDDLPPRELLPDQFQPAEAVPVLVDAEADHAALTAAAAPLVHDEGAAPQGEAALDTSGQIPLRVAPVAVEHQLDHGVRGIFIVFCREPQTVEGPDLIGLPGHGPGFPGPGDHLVPEGIVDGALRGLDGVIRSRPPLGGEKGHAEADIADAQHRQRQKGGDAAKDPKQFHERSSLGIVGNFDHYTPFLDRYAIL